MRIILLTLLFLTVHGCSMAQTQVLEKDVNCYVIRKIVPQARVDISDVKLEKFVLYDICLGEKTDEKVEVFIVNNGITKSVKAKLIKTFENGIAAQKFAEKYKIIDTDFTEIADCQIIRLINLPMSLRGDKVPNAKPEIALLNTCIMREKEWEVLPKIKLTRNGKQVELEFWDMRAFKNQTEAEEYAKQNGLTDVNFTENISAMTPNNQSDCHIIRVVEIPMTKKPNVPSEPKIALLNTCLNDTIPQQRPVIEVIRNGKKAFREFEIIRIFKDNAEAEKYAEDNGLTDVEFTNNIFDMKQNNQSDCHIIRVVGIPLIKRPEVPRELKIALLNICLNDKIQQQRPIIQVIRNGVKAFRKFEIIKIFADKTEAEKYAKVNEITDLEFF